MHVDFIANDCSTVQTYFKRIAHTWPGVYYVQACTDFPFLSAVKMCHCDKKNSEEAYIIMLEIPIKNTWH